MKIDKVFERRQKQRRRCNEEKHRGRQKEIENLNHVNSQAQTNKNSNHDLNKRIEMKSHRYSEVEK